MMQVNEGLISLIDEEHKNIEEDTPEFQYKNSIVTADEDIIKPPVLFLLMDVVFGTLGNISMIIGKAKSRKSMFLAWLTAGALGGLRNYFKSEITHKKVLYFDTEQSKYHAQLQVRRVYSLLGYKTDSLVYVALRQYTPVQRKKIIAHVLETEDNIGYVIIDGITDLMTNGVNDEAEATEICSTLMKWSEVNNIHITCVLHQNKGDSNAKGHLGSYLVQKSETVLAIEKLPDSKEISKVSPHYSRGIDIEDIHFSIDDKGIPFLIEDAVMNSYKKDRVRKNPFDYDLEFHKALLPKVFEAKKELLRSAFIEELKYHLAETSIEIGDKKLRDWIMYYKKQNLVFQDKERQPFRFNDLIGHRAGDGATTP